MMLCIGIFLILTGVVWEIFSFISSKRLIEAEGKIIGYERATSDRGRLKRLPIIEFQGPDGKNVRFTDDPSAMLGGTTVHIGQPDVDMLNPNDELEVVKVVYNPKEPSRANIKNFRNLLLGPIILICIGIGFAFSQFVGIN